MLFATNRSAASAVFFPYNPVATNCSKYFTTGGVVDNVIGGAVLMPLGFRAI
jgi:hypothetical protein